MENEGIQNRRNFLKSLGLGVVFASGSALETLAENHDNRKNQSDYITEKKIIIIILAVLMLHDSMQKI